MSSIKLTQPLFLCGMMGTGKSTIGRKLAGHYNQPFEDLDEVIEREAGMPIPEIFKRHGEAHFRKLERDLLIRKSQQTEGVLALGGGSLQNQHLTDHIKLNGWLIFIDTPEEELLRRLQASENRPMIAGKDQDERAEKIKALLNERRPLYSQAHITVKTEGLNVQEIIEQITTKLAFYEQQHRH
ncbi:MAG: shikimate kinase [Balneolaceae bacterium]|nr:shikimate kinase [Balneolaceae bacterium]MCH8547518.1 shikimate kinase [Balneolaceae bacterium]